MCALKIMKSKNLEITILLLNLTQSFVYDSLYFHYAKIVAEFMKFRSVTGNKSIALTKIS